MLGEPQDSDTEEEIEISPFLSGRRPIKREIVTLSSGSGEETMRREDFQRRNLADDLVWFEDGDGSWGVFEDGEASILRQEQDPKGSISSTEELLTNLEDWIQEDKVKREKEEEEAEKEEKTKGEVSC